MKAILTIAYLLMLLNAAAQSTGPGTLKTKSDTARKSLGGYVKVEGIDGEKGHDTLPPRLNSGLMFGGGIINSNFSNSNLPPRSTVSSRTSFTITAGYFLGIKKGRLLINASYSDGGVVVASGDINGDGIPDKETMKLGIVSIPLQYHHFFDRKNIFFGGGGASLSLLLPAVQKLNAYNEGFKRVDAGLIVSAGAKITNRILLQAAYQYGLTDIDKSAANRARNGLAFLMLNYVFVPKP